MKKTVKSFYFVPLVFTIFAITSAFTNSSKIGDDDFYMASKNKNLAVWLMSSPSDFSLPIEGQSCGQTPWTDTLAFGGHNIRMQNSKKTVNEQINISQKGQSGFSNDICPASVSDADGNIYNTIQIGNQCWMQENLRVGTRIDDSQRMSRSNGIEKYCYDDDPANCEAYGGSYEWDEMMQYTKKQGAQGICPNGWHIPTDDEWKVMEMVLGMSQSEAIDGGVRGTDQGKQIKSTSGWDENGNGTNTSSFNALPSGFHYSGGASCQLGEHAFWWSSSQVSANFAWCRGLDHDNDQVGRYYDLKLAGFSVRCLKD